MASNILRHAPMTLLCLGFMLFSITQRAYGSNEAPYSPGLDLGINAQTASLEYQRSDGAMCGANCRDDLMQSGPSLSLFLQRPFHPAWHRGVLFADYGFGFSIKYFDLTNDPAKNGISTQSSSATADGSIVTTTLVPDHTVKLDIFGVNPFLFVQTGLAIPYIPYLVLTGGVGYQYNYGTLNLDSQSQTVQGGSPTLLVSTELIFLRFSHLWISAYLTASPTTSAMTMRADKGEPASYKMQFWQTTLGIKAHLR